MNDLGTNEITYLLIASGGVILFVIIPLIIYLLTMQNTFKAISEENRRMEPTQVWLMLIPLFGLVWHFIIVNRMTESLQSEFAAKKIAEDVNKSKNIGIACCVLFCCFIIPILGSLALIGGIVCWIIYWIKINEYKNKLEQAIY